MVKGVAFKGDIKDVCAELEREAERCKGMTVSQYYALKKIEKTVDEQLDEISKNF